MVSSMNTYYEKNIYADAKKIAGFKYLMEEFRLAAAREEETQLDISPPPKKLSTAPQSQISATSVTLLYDPINKLFVGKLSLNGTQEIFNPKKSVSQYLFPVPALRITDITTITDASQYVIDGNERYQVTEEGWQEVADIKVLIEEKSLPVAPVRSPVVKNRPIKTLPPRSQPRLPLFRLR